MGSLWSIMFFGLVSCFVSSVVIVFFSLFCEARYRTLLSCWKFLRTRKKRRKRLQNRGEMSGGAGGGAVGSAKTPADFLKSIRGRPVVVKLNSGVDYRGILACLDGYMNIAMEQTEEYVNGQLKNKYGDAFIRGNNVLYISTTKRTLGDA